MEQQENKKSIRFTCIQSEEPVTTITHLLKAEFIVDDKPINRKLDFEFRVLEHRYENEDSSFAFENEDEELYFEKITGKSGSEILKCLIIEISNETETNGSAS